MTCVMPAPFRIPFIDLCMRSSSKLESGNVGHDDPKAGGRVIVGRGRRTGPIHPDGHSSRTRPAFIATWSPNSWNIPTIIASVDLMWLSVNWNASRMPAGDRLARPAARTLSD